MNFENKCKLNVNNEQIKSKFFLLQCMNTDTWHNLLIQIGETFSMRFFIKNSVHSK